MLRRAVISQRRWQQHRIRLFSDKQRRAENAALLKATRNKLTKPDAKKVNYRLREGQESASIASMWGEEEEEDKFVHFFDQVDAHMGRHKTQRQPRTNLEALFDSLEQHDSKSKETQAPPLILSDSVTGKRRSILDAFPIPPPPETAPRSPNAFEQESYDQYLAIVNEIMEDKKYIGNDVVTKWLRSDEPLMDYHLPILDQSVQQGRVCEPEDLSFRSELEQQRVAFMKAFSIDETQYKQATRALMIVGRKCAKLAKSSPLDVAWEKVKESGMMLNNDSLSNYLYVSSTYYSLSNRSVGPMESILDILDPHHKSDDKNAGEPDEPEEENVVDVAEEVAAFHDNLHKPTEQSLSVRVRALVRKSQAKAAELLVEKSDIEVLRLRTYQPILDVYLKQGDLKSALSMFKRMRDTPSVILGADTYVLFIAAVAENGYFHEDSPPIDGAEQVGFTPGFGPELLNKLVAALAEDVLEITPALAKRLYSATEKAFKNSTPGRNLEEMHPLAPLQVNNTPADPDEVIASRVEIDTSTGVCPKSEARLSLIKLDRPQRERVKAGLLELVSKEYERFNRNSQFKRKAHQTNPEEQMKKFANFLDKRRGEPYTAIIDGANVAFYLQNFDEGKFNFYQLQFMVDALIKRKENPLVVLPAKYTRNYFHIMRGNGMQKQYMNRDEISILERLREAGRLYIVPPRCLDDLFWMAASVSDQAVSSNGNSLDVLAEDPDGRWPGTRPMLISNDQMRDHKLELIEPRLFRRWYSSHIVNYNFTGFVDSECVDDEIGFSPADFFSREIQGNQTDDSGTVTWHFPVSEWDENQRFCLRIPKRKI